MRFAALAFVMMLAGTGAAWAAEDYRCTNHGRAYPVSFDREKRTLSIDGKAAAVEHMEWASAVAGIRGTIDLGNTIFWAELNNVPSIAYMKDQRVIRVDHCRYIDEPAT